MAPPFDPLGTKKKQIFPSSKMTKASSLFLDAKASLDSVLENGDGHYPLKSLANEHLLPIHLGHLSWFVEFETRPGVLNEVDRGVRLHL